MKAVNAWILITPSTGDFWMHNDHPSIYLDKELADVKASSISLEEGGHPSVVPCSISFTV